jgi:uncharacterized membrane protein YccC
MSAHFASTQTPTQWNTGTALSGIKLASNMLLMCCLLAAAVVAGLATQTPSVAAAVVAVQAVISLSTALSTRAKATQ